MYQTRRSIRVAALSTLFFLALSVAVAPRAHAQLGDAGEILRSGANDANLLMENYLKPFGAGFGANLNAGWVNTARAYRPFGFDLRANAGVSLVPSADQSFNVTSLAFQEVSRLGGSATTPTISGDDFSDTQIGKEFTYTDGNGNQQTEELFSFVMPQGIGFPYVPAPMIQLTVGAVKDTDVSVRYFPTYDIEDVGSIGMFGFGVKHGVNQWLPGGDMLPVDLSLQFGYTSLDVSAEFDVQPVIDGDTYAPSGYEAGAVRWNGQGADLKASGYTINALVGKTLPILSIFGGLGMESSKMTIKTPGNYPLTSPNDNYDPNAPAGSQESYTKAVESIAAPIDLNLDGENSFHAMAGLRIRLAILTISGSYTLAKYPVANVGVGISFR
ncbi:MAG: DUF6588 family protein [Balneolaceae bacterium]